MVKAARGVVRRSVEARAVRRRQRAGASAGWVDMSWAKAARRAANARRERTKERRFRGKNE